MALDTYAGLKLAIADYLDNADLVSQIDDFIDLAEGRHKREVRIREMQDRQALTVAARYVDLPIGYLEALGIRLLTDPVTPLGGALSWEELTKRRQETTGKPAYYTIHEQIEFDRTPDQSYSGEILFYKAVTALSDSNTSNEVLAKDPAFYLFAALAEAAPFLGADERVALWEGKYARTVDAWKEATRRSTRPGPLVARPSGATP